MRAGTAVFRFPVPGLRWSTRAGRARACSSSYLRAQIPAKRAGDGADLFSALVPRPRTRTARRFSDDDIVNHMIFLLMAAHDTTTITMTTMAYYLAKHPRVAGACRAESLRARHADAAPTSELDRLADLDLVMKECMRLVTAVPGLARKTVKDTEVLGFPIPADTYVSVSLHGTQHLAEYWPDPSASTLNGSRPTDARTRSHRNAWIPFGGGVHKCIGLHFGGMQVKAAMHQLLLATAGACR